MYDKKLKRGKDGLFTRYIGQNSRGVAEKFRLGYDQEAAEQKVRLIAALWTEIEKHAPPGHKPSWDAESLASAKAIAKGEPPKLPKHRYEFPDQYVRRVAEVSQATGVRFEPARPADYQFGLDSLQDEIAQSRQALSSSQEVKEATGTTLGKAVGAYEAHVRRSFTGPDGYLRPWGRTKLDQLDSIRLYLADERFGGRDFLKLDLAELSYGRCDEVYGVFRRRPLTLRSKLQKRMAPSSAKNLIKELGNFFDWLDGAEEFDWTLPRRFRSIKKTPDDLTAPEHVRPPPGPGEAGDPGRAPQGAVRVRPADRAAALAAGAQLRLRRLGDRSATQGVPEAGPVDHRGHPVQVGQRLQALALGPDPGRAGVDARPAAARQGEPAPRIGTSCSSPSGASRSGTTPRRGTSPTG